MSLSELPDAGGKEREKVFHKLGWVTRRQSTHIVMTHPNIKGVTLSIPNQRRVKRTIIHASARLAGITDSVYREIFDSL